MKGWIEDMKFAGAVFAMLVGVIAYIVGTCLIVDTNNPWIIVPFFVISMYALCLLLVRFTRI